MENMMRRTTAPRSRPLGVWLLTIFDGFVAGVVPLLTAFAVIDGGGEGVPGGTMTAVLLAGLGLGILGAAIGAWQGSNRARVVLLALLAIFYSLNIAISLRVATADWVPESAQAKSLATAVRGLFWLGINLWYFMRPQTRAWYRAMSK